MKQGSPGYTLIHDFRSQNTHILSTSYNEQKGGSDDEDIELMHFHPGQGKVIAQGHKAEVDYVIRPQYRFADVYL